MNIIVCIKQVPDSDNIRLNTETNTIIREEVKSIINHFDDYALEEGLRIKERMGKGSVTALSMGIHSAAELLREAISIGADNGILLNDISFAGADTLATAYTLSMAVKKIAQYDLIICGKQAIDGDTAQVGSSLAEKLDIPHVTNIKMIEAICEEYIICQRLTEYGYDRVKLKLPALISVVKDINELRLPSLKGALRAKNAVINVWNAQDISADKRLCGHAGSPTRVVETFTPVFDVKSELLEGNPREQAKLLADRLMKSGKLIIDKN